MSTEIKQARHLVNSTFEGRFPAGPLEVFQAMPKGIFGQRICCEARVCSGQLKGLIFVPGQQLGAEKLCFFVDYTLMLRYPGT